MIGYVARRLLWGVVLLLLVSALVFVVFYVLPSADPAALRAGRRASPEMIEQVRATLGLDRSLPLQYWEFLKRLVLHFDLGYSYSSEAPVATLIADRLPATISLTLGAVLIWLALAIPIGTLSALRPRGWVDRFSAAGALIGISAPVYWVGLVALFLFAADIGRFPLLPGANSYVALGQDPLAWLGSLVLPWLVLAAAFAGVYARMLRGSLADVMSQDFIRTARAKGLGRRRVVVRHGLRVALAPLVTLLGIDIGLLLGGAILTETVFNIPGVGRLGYDAIVHADLPVIQGVVLLSALFVVLANIAVDVSYALLDPRVRHR